jgi:signal transduction histidine kinase
VIVMLLGVNIAYRMIFSELRRSLDDSMSEQLAGLAESFAEGIDALLLSGATSEGRDFAPEAFLRLWDAARAYALANRLVDVTILDTAWNDLLAADSDSLSRAIGALLDQDARRPLLAGLTWVSESYSWGESFYRSAFAPIFDPADGVVVAVVRIEADAEYFSPLARLSQVGWLIHVLSLVLAVALAGVFWWYNARERAWEHNLLHSEKLIGLGRLAATIAHEIRNPLGIIKATAQRLERLESRGAISSEERRELLHFIPEETDRLNRILTGYLGIADPVAPRPVAIDVHDHLRDWIAIAYDGSDPGAHAPDVRIEETGPILADAEAPRQVIINLVRNAIDASPQGSSVTIEWKRTHDDRLSLEVADAGAGIPDKMRERVFEPFYTTKVRGSGLGLYAVKTLVERDGGSVAVIDNPGGGARFIVTWPKAPSDPSLQKAGAQVVPNTDRR